MSLRRIFSLYVIAFAGDFVNSFHANHLSRHAVHPSFVVDRTGRQELSAVSDSNESKSRTKGATLTLEGRTTKRSNPVPFKSIESITEFFKVAKHRNLLATAGGKRPLEVIEPTPGLLKIWENACDGVGSTYPNENDVVLKVKTGGIDFPGIKVTSVVKIGAKLIEPENPDENVRYEFTSLGDERSVTGLRPVVWIFEKLSGGDGGKDGGSTTTKSLTKFTFEQVKGEKVVFSSDSFLSVVVNFPSILLKILPTTKEKAEENGGKSIAKVLEKDVEAAINTFEETYLKWLDNGVN